MGAVYLARRVDRGGFHKWLAIKRIHPHLARRPQFVAMFLDEARIAAGLEHPNLCQVFALEHDRDIFLKTLPHGRRKSLKGWGDYGSGVKQSTLAGPHWLARLQGDW